MPQLLRPYNPLIYPGGRLPGFDQSHPASQGAALSAVSVVGNFVSLLNGGAGTLNGTPSFVLGPVGPSMRFGGGGTTDGIKIPGAPTAAQSAWTIGTIVSAAAAPSSSIGI